MKDEITRFDWSAERAEQASEHDALDSVLPLEANRQIIEHRLIREQGREEMLSALHQHFDRNVETEKQKILSERHQLEFRPSWAPKTVSIVSPSKLDERARAEVERRYRSWIAEYDRATKQQQLDILQGNEMSLQPRRPFKRAAKDRERNQREKDRGRIR